MKWQASLDVLYGDIFRRNNKPVLRRTFWTRVNMDEALPGLKRNWDRFLNLDFSSEVEVSMI